MADEKPSLLKRLTGFFAGAEPAPPEPLPHVPGERNPELEAAIVENPDDQDAWAVFGDWLSTIGDARGELVSLALLDPPPEEAEARSAQIVAKYQRAWLGAELSRVAALKKRHGEVLRVEWRHGFVDRARVRGSRDWKKERPVDEILGELLRHPSCRFLRHLGIGLMRFDVFDDNMQPGIDAVERHGEIPSLSSLLVGDFEYPDEMEISWAGVGDVEPLYALLPNLEILHVRGRDVHLGTLRHEKLRRLKIESGGLPENAARAVAEADLPSLVDLEVWLGDENHGADSTVESLQALFGDDAPRRFPKLKRLALKNCMYTDAIAEALADAPLLERCDRLDLSMGTLTNDGARVFVDRAERFGHLKEINLEENLLFNMQESLIEAYGKRIRTRNQREYEDYLYTAVGE